MQFFLTKHSKRNWFHFLTKQLCKCVCYIKQQFFYSFMIYFWVTLRFYNNNLCIFVFKLRYTQHKSFGRRLCGQVLFMMWRRHYSTPYDIEVLWSTLCYCVVYQLYKISSPLLILNKTAQCSNPALCTTQDRADVTVESNMTLYLIICLKKLISRRRYNVVKLYFPVGNGFYVLKASLCKVEGVNTKDLHVFRTRERVVITCKSLLAFLTFKYKRSLYSDKYTFFEMTVYFFKKTYTTIT